MSDSLRPHGSQHSRPPCPSQTPGIHSNSCPLSWWCHPTISSSVIPFSSRIQSFPASGSFPMSQFFASKYWNFNFSISPSNEYSGLISFRIDWLDLLAVQETLKKLINSKAKSNDCWDLEQLIKGRGYVQLFVYLKHYRSICIMICRSTSLCVTV